MNGIINGAELSTYKTIAISLGQSKKENRNKVKSNFIVLSIKDKGSMLSKTRRIVLFDEDLPGVFDMLKAYAATTPNGATGGYDVDMKALKASDDAEELAGLFEFPGGMVVEYPLKKGMCYANDVNGNRIKDGNGKDVMKDTISIFVQVKNYVPTENGGMKPVYYDGFGFDEVGSNAERRFWAVPVNNQPVQQTPEPDPTIQQPATDTQPEQRPF